MPQSPDPVIDPVIDPEPGGGRALGTATYIKSLDWVSDARLYRLVPPVEWSGGYVEHVVVSLVVNESGPYAGEADVLVSPAYVDGGLWAQDDGRPAVPGDLGRFTGETHESVLGGMGYEVVGGPLVVGSLPSGDLVIAQPPVPPSVPGDIVFRTGEEERLRLCGDGSVLVNGRKVKRGRVPVATAMAFRGWILDAAQGPEWCREHLDWGGDLSFTSGDGYPALNSGGGSIVITLVLPTVPPKVEE